MYTDNPSKSDDQQPTSSWDDFINAADEANPVTTGKASTGPYAREQFTCESCNGTGKWHGGTNQYGNRNCNTCHGRGYLVTSPEARAKAKTQRRSNKADAARRAQKANMETGLLQELNSMSDWNSFAASLTDQHGRGKAWSEKQIAAAKRMVEKVRATRARKEAEREERIANAPQVDLTPIMEMFETAMASGYKKPMYRAEGLRIKPGKGGSLYVMTEDRMEYGRFGEQPGYEGKIVDGKFIAVRKAEANTPERLQTIAADPKGVAIRYGQRTGRCSCCGRELTKHTSIEAGIGPICAEKWGL